MSKPSKRVNRVVPQSWDAVLQSARYFTTRELCEISAELHAAGNLSHEDGVLEAIGIHARRKGWGELIEASINGWEGGRAGV